VKVIRLQRECLEDIVDVLVRSFLDYPMMRYVLQDAGQAYESRLRRFVGYFTGLRFTSGYPVLGIAAPDGGRLQAAANINPPRKAAPEPLLEHAFEELRESLGEPAIARFRAAVEASDTLEPGQPHYYLAMLGVVPEARGRGLGRGLLDRLHDLSAEDVESTGVCLTTEAHTNLALYEHFGYRVLGRVVTPDGQLESWTLFREDRPPTCRPD